MSRRILAAIALLCAVASPARSERSTSLLIIGDCIATRAGLGGRFPGAVVDATVGIASAAIVKRARPGFVDTVVSAGTNDITRRTPPGRVATLQVRLRAHLQAIRSRLDGRVLWLVPAYGPAGDIVLAVAAEHGDRALSFRTGPDGYHPASYGALARAVAPFLSQPYALSGASGTRSPASHTHPH